jgi:hypothetical protein
VNVVAATIATARDCARIGIGFIVWVFAIRRRYYAYVGYPN